MHHGEGKASPAHVPLVKLIKLKKYINKIGVDKASGARGVHNDVVYLNIYSKKYKKKPKHEEDNYSTNPGPSAKGRVVPRSSWFRILFFLEPPPSLARGRNRAAEGEEV